MKVSLHFITVFTYYIYIYSYRFDTVKVISKLKYINNSEEKLCVYIYIRKREMCSFAEVHTICQFSLRPLTQYKFYFTETHPLFYLGHDRWFKCYTTREWYIFYLFSFATHNKFHLLCNSRKSILTVVSFLLDRVPHDKIYTWVGPTLLLAINPIGEMSISNISLYNLSYAFNKYDNIGNLTHEEVVPHIYAVASKAHHRIIHGFGKPSQVNPFAFLSG